MKNISKGLFKYFENGYFDMSFPEIFKINWEHGLTENNQETAENIFELFHKKSKAENNDKWYPHYFLEISENVYRTKGIPHIVPYILFFKFLLRDDSKKFLSERINNLNSDKSASEYRKKVTYVNLSPLFSYYGDYPIFLENIRFSETDIKDFSAIRELYIERQREISQENFPNGFKIILDIINFYPSVYTHKIFKIQFLNSISKDGNFYVSEKKSRMQNFDKQITKLKNHQTNGILIGPVSSVIFSEIVLNQISHLLWEHGLKFEKYCDEFTFYFDNKREYTKKIFIIWKVFNFFNLNVREKKKDKTSLGEKGVFKYKNINEFVNLIDNILNVKGPTRNKNYINQLIWEKRRNRNYEGVHFESIVSLFKNMIKFPKFANNILNLMMEVLEEGYYLSDLLNYLKEYDVNSIIQNKEETKVIWFFYLKYKLLEKITNYVPDDAIFNKNEIVNQVRKDIKDCFTSDLYICSSMIWFMTKNIKDYDLEELKEECKQLILRDEKSAKSEKEAGKFIFIYTIGGLKKSKLIDKLKSIKFSFFKWNAEIRYNVFENIY